MLLGKLKPSCALVQAMHTPRAIPSVLAALAGFAIAVASLRWEAGLSKERHVDDKADKPPGADRPSDEPRSQQAARAAHPGRRRGADTPTKIPARGSNGI